MDTSKTARVFPAADAVLRKMNAANVDDSRIAKRLGVSRQAVQKRRDWLGLPAVRYKLGQRHRICAVPNSARHVRAVRSAGWPWPVPGVPDRITPRGVRLLILLLNGPHTKDEVAAEFGCKSGRVFATGKNPLFRDAVRSGLVMRLPDPRMHMGRRWLYALTIAGENLMLAAARRVAEGAAG